MIQSPSSSADTNPNPLWHRLKPGDYDCGFRSLWQLDYGRTYNLTFDDKTSYAAGKSPRPILTNIWYPANREISRSGMPYGEYLRVGVENGPLAKFSAELIRYARGVIAREVFWKEEGELSPAEQEAFQTLMETATAAFRDAPAAHGRFPIVLYHGGYGSSFEDSSVLCEFLASHGYVVIGSPFSQVDGKSLNIEGKVRTAGDIRFLLAFAQSLPFTDWNHVGMVGHSGGAHAALIYQTEPGCAVDATISLDTTEDYYSLAFPGWQRIRDAVKEALPTLTRPILFAAKPWAGFEMAESMTATPRYLFTVDSLHHDDFITHGSLARWMKLRLASEEERDSAEADANLIWNRYETLCQTALHFLDATLKGQTTDLEAQWDHDQPQPLRGDQPHLAYLAPGLDSPEPYVATDSAGPSPRQIRQLLRTIGGEATVAILRASWQPQRDAFAYVSQFTIGLLYELVAKGLIADASALYAFLSDIGHAPDHEFLHWSKYHAQGRTFLEYLLAVNPENTEALAALKLMDEAKASAE